MATACGRPRSCLTRRRSPWRAKTRCPSSGTRSRRAASSSTTMTRSTKSMRCASSTRRRRWPSSRRSRASLDGVIQNAPDDVAIAGEGELISLKGSPQVGRRKMTLSADGTVERVDYVQYPSGWILERKGGKPRGKLLLTFDDGPDPKWTPRVLDALDRAPARAAFFVIGENAEAHPELVRREMQAGHVVGNHTYSHPDLSRVSPLRFDLELNVTERLLEWVTGTHPRLFRPPYHSDEALDEPLNAQVVARAAS